MRDSTKHPRMPKTEEQVRAVLDEWAKAAIDEADFGDWEEGDMGAQAMHRIGRAWAAKPKSMDLPTFLFRQLIVAGDEYADATDGLFFLLSSGEAKAPASSKLKRLASAIERSQRAIEAVENELGIRDEEVYDTRLQEHLVRQYVADCGGLKKVPRHLMFIIPDWVEAKLGKRKK